MLENENEKKIPEVEFTFREEGKSEEEINKEIEYFLKKTNERIEYFSKEKNEYFASIGIPVPTTNETETNEMSND